MYQIVFWVWIELGIILLQKILDIFDNNYYLIEIIG
jgi:hypothetical protein